MGSSMAQGDLWSAAARRWAHLQAPLHAPLWNAMLDAVGVGRGSRFLDAGCGGGGASVLARRRGAVVSGLDAASALIAIARDRLPEADFRVGDLESLPFAEKAFDVAFAANSLPYAADRMAALTELKRVCVPGGRVVVGTWGSPDRCEQRAILEAVRSALPAPPPGEGPFALSAAGTLERLLEGTGCTVTGTGEASCPFEYPDLETYWQAQSSAGPLQAAARVVGEKPLRAALETAAQPYRTPSGGVRFENVFLFVAATT